MAPNNNQPSSFNQGIFLLGLLFADIITAVILLIAVINIPRTPAVVGKYSYYSKVEIYSDGTTKETLNPYKDYGITYTAEFLADGTGKIETSLEYSMNTIPFTWDEEKVVMDMSSIYSGPEASHTEKYSLSEDKQIVCFLYEAAHTSIYTSTDQKNCFKRIQE